MWVTQEVQEVRVTQEVQEVRVAQEVQDVEELYKQCSKGADRNRQLPLAVSLEQLKIIKKKLGQRASVNVASMARLSKKEIMTASVCEGFLAQVLMTKNHSGC